MTNWWGLASYFAFQFLASLGSEYFGPVAFQLDLMQQPYSLHMDIQKLVHQPFHGFLILTQRLQKNLVGYFRLFSDLLLGDYFAILATTFFIDQIDLFIYQSTLRSAFLTESNAFPGFSFDFNPQGQTHELSSHQYSDALVSLSQLKRDFYVSFSLFASDYFGKVQTAAFSSNGGRYVTFFGSSDSGFQQSIFFYLLLLVIYFYIHRDLCDSWPTLLELSIYSSQQSSQKNCLMLLQYRLCLGYVHMLYLKLSYAHMGIFMGLRVNSTIRYQNDVSHSYTVFFLFYLNAVLLWAFTQGNQAYGGWYAQLEECSPDLRMDWPYSMQIDCSPQQVY